MPAAGSYDVYLYKIVNSAGDPAARVDVTHNGGTATSSINFSTGSTGWVRLGTWSFNAGENGSVLLTTSSAGYARADAVKFVRAS